MYRYISQRLAIMIPTVGGDHDPNFPRHACAPRRSVGADHLRIGGELCLERGGTASGPRKSGPRPALLCAISQHGWVRLFSGDLDLSFWTKEPIRDLILRRGPITGQIALMAVIFSWTIGVPIGMFSAIWRNSAFDHISRVMITVFIAVPSFWLGLLTILATVLIFTWRPPLTIVQLWEDPVANLSMTTLPALALGLGLAAANARMARSSALEVMYDDYIRTARAKGLPDHLVMWRHVFKNAMLPVITTSGVALGGLLGGAVSVERAFGVPGLAPYLSRR